MNPGEQDLNPFRRSTSAGSRAGHYLSGRPNFPQQKTPNFYPTPTPTPPQKKRKSLKPVLIIAGIIAVIAVIIISISMAIPSIGRFIDGTNKNHNLKELQAVLNDHYTDVILMEQYFGGLNVAKNTLWEIDEYGDYKARRTNMNTAADALSSIKQLREELDKYGNIEVPSGQSDNIDVNEYLEKTKTTLDKHASALEKIVNIYFAIIDIYEKEANEESLAKLRDAYPGKHTDKIAALLKEYFAAHAKICEDDTEQCRNNNRKNFQAKESVKSDESLEKIILGITSDIRTEDSDTSLMILINSIVTLNTEEPENEEQK